MGSAIINCLDVAVRVAIPVRDRQELSPPLTRRAIHRIEAVVALSRLRGRQVPLFEGERPPFHLWSGSGGE